MYEEGTLLVHPNYGVCKILGIGKVDMRHASKESVYYTLEPLYDGKSKLYIPTDSEKLILRPVMTKESAEALIGRLSEIEPLTVQNEKEREKVFRELLQTGDCENISRIVKTLYLRKKARLLAGKKAVSLDEKYLYIAREHLYGELAVSLGIDKDHVEDYITKCIEKV